MLTLLATVMRIVLLVETSEGRVIVLRAWWNPEGVRVRVLIHDGSRRQWVVAGIPAACALVATLLDALQPPPTTETTHD